VRARPTRPEVKRRVWKKNVKQREESATGGVKGDRFELKGTGPWDTGQMKKKEARNTGSWNNENWLLKQKGLGGRIGRVFYGEWSAHKKWHGARVRAVKGL